MRKAMTVILAASMALAGCGTTIKERITATAELEKEKKQSAGNVSLAASLLEARPPIDLNRTGQ